MSPLLRRGLRRVPGRSRRGQRKSARKVGVNALNWHAWQLARRRTLRRAGYRCEACGTPGYLEVHHIKPLHKGGDAFDMTNLMALCKTCHLKAHGHDKTPQQREWLKRMKEYDNGI